MRKACLGRPISKSRILCLKTSCKYIHSAYILYNIINNTNVLYTDLEVGTRK